MSLEKIEKNRVTIFNSKSKDVNIRVLSNFYINDFMVDDIVYSSGEQCFHHQKFKILSKLSNDGARQKILATHAAKILTLETPSEAKKMGGKSGLVLSSVEQKSWSIRAGEIQRQISMAKLKTIESLSTILSKTGTKMLLHQENRASKKSRWGGRLKEGVIIGQNELGKIWMELRTNLSSSVTTASSTTKPGGSSLKSLDSRGTKSTIFFPHIHSDIDGLFEFYLSPINIEGFKALYTDFSNKPNVIGSKLVRSTMVNPLKITLLPKLEQFFTTIYQTSNIANIFRPGTVKNTFKKTDSTVLGTAVTFSTNIIHSKSNKPLDYLNYGLLRITDHIHYFQRQKNRPLYSPFRKGVIPKNILETSSFVLQYIFIIIHALYPKIRENAGKNFKLSQQLYELIKKENLNIDSHPDLLLRLEIIFNVNLCIFKTITTKTTPTSTMWSFKEIVSSDVDTGQEFTHSQSININRPTVFIHHLVTNNNEETSPTHALELITFLHQINHTIDNGTKNSPTLPKEQCVLVNNGGINPILQYLVDTYNEKIDDTVLPIELLSLGLNDPGEDTKSSDDEYPTPEPISEENSLLSQLHDWVSLVLLYSDNNSNQLQKEELDNQIGKFITIEPDDFGKELPVLEIEIDGKKILLLIGSTHTLYESTGEKLLVGKFIKKTETACDILWCENYPEKLISNQ